LAEEIVQDVFTSLWEKKDVLEIIKIYPYLIISVRNTAFQQLSNAKKQTQLKLAITERQKFEHDPNEKLLAINITPIKKQIALLPSKCRQIMQLKINEGLTNEEIAEYLGVSIKTVENQVTMGYKKLRASLNIVSIILGGLSLLSVI